MGHRFSWLRDESSWRGLRIVLYTGNGFVAPDAKVASVVRAAGAALGAEERLPPCVAFNVAGLPAAVISCGETAAGLPIVVQVVARPWRKDIALAIAARLEREFGGWRAPSEEGT
jgi:amidase